MVTLADFGLSVSSFESPVYVWVPLLPSQSVDIKYEGIGFLKLV